MLREDLNCYNVTEIIRSAEAYAYLREKEGYLSGRNDGYKTCSVKLSELEDKIKRIIAHLKEYKSINNNFKCNYTRDSWKAIDEAIKIAEGE